MTELFFRYRLAGADGCRVLLSNSRTGFNAETELKAARRDTWSEATLSFQVPGTGNGDVLVDEIRFLLPRDATLLIDDLLLYVPGRE
jgi:hypothetical protein